MAMYSSFGFFLAFMMAVSQLALVKKTYKNYFSAVFYFVCSFVIFNSYLYFSKNFANFPFLIQSHLPTMFLLPALLYIYFKIIIEQEYKFSKTSLLHLLPAVGGLVVYLLNFNYDIAIRLAEIYKPFQNQTYNMNTVTYFVSSVVFLMYISYMFYMVRMLFTIESLKNSNLSKILLMAFIMTFIGVIFLIMMFVLRKKEYLYIANSILVTLFFLLNIIGRRYPLFFEDLQTYVSEQRYQRSLIEDIDLEALNESLVHLMEVDKAYRDEDLNMNQLAILLGISAHQFSQYINQRLNKNFSTLINEYRVNAACNSMLAEPDKSILTIAYEVGFNSKSVFNKAFIKYKNLTPTQYKKKNMPI